MTIEELIKCLSRFKPDSNVSFDADDDGCVTMSVVGEKESEAIEMDW